MNTSNIGRSHVQVLEPEIPELEPEPEIVEDEEPYVSPVYQVSVYQTPIYRPPVQQPTPQTYTPPVRSSVPLAREKRGCTDKNKSRNKWSNL